MRSERTTRTFERAMAALTGAMVLFAIAGVARAQNVGPGPGVFNNLYPDFASVQNPGQLGLTLFGGGFGSDKYGTTQQGFQLEQSVTQYIGVFGRATGYQLYMGQGFDSPLAPGTGHSARFNFGRFQGGMVFKLYPGTTLFISYGHDVADSDANIIEGDFSSWLMPHSRHPINLSFSSIYDDQNGVVSNEVDIQAVVLTTEDYMFLAGAGGAFYKGGFVSSGGEGQGGPDLGLYYRPWRLGFTVQAGYGSAHQYGQISIYKQLLWSE